MEASEARYRWIVETSQEGILIHDLDGVITFANPVIASMLRTVVADVEGRSLFEFIEPAERAAARHRLEQRRKGVCDQYEFTFRRSDGTPLDAIVSASPRLDTDGVASAVLNMVTDVSVRKRKRTEAASARLELERERAHQLVSLGQLAGGIAHDFNNLLGVISNYAALIKAQASDKQTLSDLQEIDNATVVAAALTRQLLAFARQDVVEPQRIDVNRAETVQPSAPPHPRRTDPASPRTRREHTERARRVRRSETTRTGFVEHCDQRTRRDA